MIQFSLLDIQESSNDELTRDCQLMSKFRKQVAKVWVKWLLM